MDFNGFQLADFEFFKRKDKLEKEDYEKIRNELKNHFRGLCYGIQRLYHSNTGGVFELQKDFQNFNKRSTNISVEHECQNNYRIFIVLDSEGLNLELLYKIDNQEKAGYILNILKSRKKIIWEYMMLNKNMHLAAQFFNKNRLNESVNLTSIDINNKNYDSFIENIEKYLNQGKNSFNISIGYSYNKKECIKQSKNFLSSAYGATVKLMEIEKMIG